MVYALGGRSLFWNAATPRLIESELCKWPIDPEELDMYYGIAEKALHVTTNYANGSAMQRVLLKRLQDDDIFEAIDMPLAFDMFDSRPGVEVISPDKRKHIIRAKNIIVSASTLETPRLLLNSGVPGPSIGWYLTDHVSVIPIGLPTLTAAGPVISNVALAFRLADYIVSIES